MELILCLWNHHVINKLLPIIIYHWFFPNGTAFFMNNNILHHRYANENISDSYEFSRVRKTSTKLLGITWDSR